MIQLTDNVLSSSGHSIVSFLKALTGEIPGDYIAKPELPASGPDTPKPDR